MSIGNWLSVIAILIALLSLSLSLVVTMKSWHKSRAVHELEELVLRKVTGSRDDVDRGIKEINKKLQTGKYAIQDIQYRIDDDWAVILAQIKK